MEEEEPGQLAVRMEVIPSDAFQAIEVLPEGVECEQESFRRSVAMITAISLTLGGCRVQLPRVRGTLGGESAGVRRREPDHPAGSVITARPIEHHVIVVHQW